MQTAALSRRMQGCASRADARMRRASASLRIINVDVSPGCGRYAAGSTGPRASRCCGAHIHVRALRAAARVARGPLAIASARSSPRACARAAHAHKAACALRAHAGFGCSVALRADAPGAASARSSAAPSYGTAGASRKVREATSCPCVVHAEPGAGDAPCIPGGGLGVGNGWAASLTDRRCRPKVASRDFLREVKARIGG